MTEYEKMEKGMLYFPGDQTICDEQTQYLDRLWEFNRLRPSQYNEKMALQKDLFAECGEDCYIELPISSNWGCHHVHMGERIYINTNMTFVDDGHIYIGDYTMFGPNVVIATAAHPADPQLRKRGLQYNKDVRIGKNVWVGAGVIILPGVTIGDDVIIGAGSVVTRDIPSGVIAVGNPCRVLREVGERDRIYYYKDEKIDYSELLDKYFD